MKYETKGEIGTSVPGSSPALWDYFNNTVGTDYETQGIDAKQAEYGYDSNQAGWDAFKAELEDVIFKGNL